MPFDKEEDCPELEMVTVDQQDVFRIIQAINEFKAACSLDVLQERWGILEDATKLHRLYHEFSMKEESNGEFDRTLISLLFKVSQQLRSLPNPSQFEHGAGI